MEILSNDTIVALSSASPKTQTGALGGPGRAIVRLSGPRAREIAEGMIRCTPPLASGWEHDTEIPAGNSAAKENQNEHRRSRKAPVALRRAPGWRRVRGALRLQAAAIPVCAYVMPGPRSYTRQDIVEIHLPAVPPLMLEALDAAVSAGARPALPGEFTRRALLNGRISLAQAEAIGALIQAEHADEARAHAERVAKPSSRCGVASLQDALNDLLALVELGLDFSTEDVVTLPREEMLRRVRALSERFSHIANTAGYHGQEGLHTGLEPRAVLAGPTNAGKSSLFNALLGSDAALVSGSRHTTRDTVEGRYRSAQGPELVLIDTAGHSDGPDTPARDSERLLALAMDSAARALRSADVLLITADASVDAQGSGSALKSMAPYFKDALQGRVPAATVLLWTKSDLPRSPDWNAWAVGFKAQFLDSLGLPPETVASMEVSAVSGAGLAELRFFLENTAGALHGRIAAARASSQAAFRQASVRCAEALQRAGETLAAGLGEDAAIVELREAAHALAQSEGVLLGHDALTEALLERIFAHFCIGK
ncbi:MAG: 50S ribosome-binding GTPase [Planctomycetes bacterium]|nr:50S ribosome-binding GTPase [Planctomycetota bacterium]